jgi:thiopurine S-methyltransferase
VDADFWHERWDARELGFHQGQPNALLVEHFHAVEAAPGSRIFVPLCGKTLDIGWLLSQGCSVVGVELSETAVRELFDELGVDPTVSRQGALARYSAQRIDIYVGDFFELSRDTLGAVDAVYDRAALVALPADMRRRYTAHLERITSGADQLLLCFDYDQSAMDGPPFSVTGDEVGEHYSQSHEVTQLADVEFPGGLKGQTPAREILWLLKSRNAPAAG